MIDRTRRVMCSGCGVVALTIGLLLLGGAAQAQSGAGYDLTRNTIDGGGATFSSGGVFQLGGTAGQPDAGVLSNGPYTLAGGFWGVVQVAAAPPTPSRTFSRRSPARLSKEAPATGVAGSTKGGKNDYGNSCGSSRLASGNDVVYSFTTSSPGPFRAAVTPALLERLARADVVLFDGTLWVDDEMIASGTGAKTGRRMGHMPIDGEGGSLAALAGLPGRRIYIHINNTNPIRVMGSPERRKVETAGWEIAADGLKIVP